MNLAPLPLRLFAIRNLTTGHVYPDADFDSKPAAKLKRNELNAQGGNYVITYGRDHRRYAGQ